ncbi:beta-1,3-galactosyltransferase 1-like [Haliotis rubra]|uniref:beta-1,3-galactosyltransferase 1-like n=1 Tax=Haliotis rubra TaxID=36100 RepID=UPI001EE5BA08|nr:beta-1,3-galactosyltransferase 1-like [Haliotis rubra]XP_046572724.1 beta-1,3-galactosyltransferase 1-like [Haliotis rubra]XP_046572725.1 beta-1,3-galactosyltransferase 1-like [Haliotis rubra]
MEPPRLLKTFLYIITFLALLMIVNILTSVNYLYTIINVSQVSLVSSGKTSFIGRDAPHNANLSFASLKRVQGNALNVTTKPLFTSTKPVVTSTKPVVTSTKPVVKSTPAPGVRQDVCADCFVHNFTYLIQNTAICSQSPNVTIDLFIVILTIHSDRKQRDNIRATWASTSKNNTGNVRYAFLLGKINDEKKMLPVYNESAEFGDLIMEDFHDSYANLTYKTIMGMKWATLYCARARFFMKTDDDMWVNVPEMIKLLNQKEAVLQKVVGGSCHLAAGPIRDQRSKWYASFKSYPHKTYPGFCSGTGYVTSMAVTKKLYEVSANVPFFHLEDVYIALCIRKLGMTLLPLPGFHNYRTALDPCQMRSSRILTSHEVPTDFLQKVWAAKC